MIVYPMLFWLVPIRICIQCTTRPFLLLINSPIPAGMRSRRYVLNSHILSAFRYFVYGSICWHLRRVASHVWERRFRT